MTFVLIVGLTLLAAAIFVLVRNATASRERADATIDQITAYGYRAAATGAYDEGGSRRSLGDVATSIGSRIRLRGLGTGEAEATDMLVSAGMYSTTPDRLLGYQVFGSVGGGLLLLWVGAVAGFATLWLVLFAIFGAVIGFLVPLTFVRRRVRLRREQIEDELPDLIDLLVVCIEAGLSFPGAMRMAADRLQGPLGQELRLTLQEQNMGLTTGAALTNLSKRADTAGVHIFTRSIVQGEALGVSMGQIMRNIAEEMRKRRKSAGRGAGAEGAGEDALPARLPHLPLAVRRHPAAGDHHDRQRAGWLAAGR